MAAAEPHPLNTEPDRLRFAYWVPNVSGGLVISKIPQRTGWDLESNVRYAKAAEDAGIEYGLTQIRFLASYGASQQHESVTFSQAILSRTRSIKLIAALLPGIWDPTVAAKQIASIDNYTGGGRIAVNVVSGWFKREFTSVGQWWLDHAERYRRSHEFIRVLKGIWTSPEETGFSFSGDFYRYNEYNLSPRPLAQPHPEIFQGGNSDDARNMAADVSDWYFMNGNDLDGFRDQIEDVKARAAKNNHRVRFAVNGFVIVRETEEEAVRVLEEIQGRADKEAVEAFGAAVKEAGASTGNSKGMWASSKFNDLIQYNDGFKTKLIGTKHQVAERLVLLKSLGADLVLTAFLHYEDEIEQFGRDVLPLVRELEKEGRGKDVDFEIARSGDVYRKQ
ncbi:Alkanesulfonate monooxygenase-like protein [Hapsidospora chrysogenum ATCC 11550]|uniref:Alkanesulfonate monooxygenase-like protein n=1 Tax=Hapsidospora chrysogenum (strain ATCC 11550 / CBS 779.69 / DSM 880 / IAM 14645 / JCM 23072 / IMI 49137) TaxID=857340 RepID=A0A086T9D0_HAPC1|nr:Alkanesulfonate monooxygenase-like protein [Hapsidospora chrysogenum ATCC 11550]